MAFFILWITEEPVAPLGRDVPFMCTARLEGDAGSVSWPFFYVEDITQ